MSQECAARSDSGRLDYVLAFHRHKYERFQNLRTITAKNEVGRKVLARAAYSTHTKPPKSVFNEYSCLGRLRAVSSRIAIGVQWLPLPEHPMRAHYSGHSYVGSLDAAAGYTAYHIYTRPAQLN